MIYLLLIISSIYLTNAFPKPTFKLHSGEGEFSIPGVNGVKNVHFIYDNGASPDESIGRAVQGVDNVWRFTAHHLSEKKVRYQAKLTFENGDVVHSSEQEYHIEPLLKLPPQRLRGAVIFRDDFNGNKLNTNNWMIAVTATGDWHNEFQCYTNDARNVYVNNGYLYLKPTLTVDSGHFTEQDLYTGVMDVNKTWGVCTDSGFRGCYRDAKNGLLPPILSGRVESYPTIKYGTVTIRAQIPKGDWLWPAIWMMPRNSTYGGWPRSGEMDMMEASCNEVMYFNDGTKVGIQRVTSTIHFGPESPEDHPLHGEKIKSHGDWHSFHIYTLDWSPDHVILSVDGEVVSRMDIPDGTSVWDKYNFNGTNPWARGAKIAPFDQEFYMILNVAVGGIRGMFGEGYVHYAYPKPWSQYDIDPLTPFWEHRNEWMPSWRGDDVAMIIDYVEFRLM
ncbi:hypothetical protein SNE40_015983 [Patella caerulea]|uniref:GH16 domain-containing protein n=1 Tax=Patella caerulea TaxID=87958 RepID=A0AAN8J804_PATCE